MLWPAALLALTSYGANIHLGAACKNSSEVALLRNLALQIITIKRSALEKLP